jgi:hypothetical protein
LVYRPGRHEDWGLSATMDLRNSNILDNQRPPLRATTAFINLALPT